MTKPTIDGAIAALEAGIRFMNVVGAVGYYDHDANLIMLRALASLRSLASAPADELPDALRLPLHSLQADTRYLFGRVVAADGAVASMMADSVLNRLSQIETACYNLFLAPADPGAGRDGVIEECARIVERHELSSRVMPIPLRDAAAAIRALKSAATAEDVGRGEDDEPLGITDRIVVELAAGRHFNKAPHSIARCILQELKTEDILPTADREAIREALKIGMDCAYRLDRSGYDRRVDLDKIAAALALLEDAP